MTELIDNPIPKENARILLRFKDVDICFMGDKTKEVNELTPMVICTDGKWGTYSSSAIFMKFCHGKYLEFVDLPLESLGLTYPEKVELGEIISRGQDAI